MKPNKAFGSLESDEGNNEEKCDSEKESDVITQETDVKYRSIQKETLRLFND